MPRDKKLFLQLRIDIAWQAQFIVLRPGPSGLWLRALCWTAQNRTDLWVSRRTRIDLGGSKRDANDLADMGLWIADDGGHWIVRNDLWAVYNSDWRERVPEWMREAVLERDGHKCLFCGADDDLQMDHIYPWSRGGETTVENLQTLCGPCNRKKGARV